MKISLQPTSHILVKASCKSEWDNCDFAIITCNEGWVERMEKRLKTAVSHSQEEDFHSLKHYDISAKFYVSKDGEAELLLNVEAEERWAYVDLGRDDEDNFYTPENCLADWTQVIFADGTARHLAYGKHTGEEFSTEDLPLREIVAQIRKDQSTRSKKSTSLD